MALALEGMSLGKNAIEKNIAAKTERQTTQLLRLTDMIGNLWGQRSECVEASALFVATARRLRIPVDARAVSILAIDTKTHRVAMTGIAAGAEAEERLGASVLGAPADISESNFKRAGHMVVTSDQLSMIFDPTFRQFAREGLPDAIVAGPIVETRPPEGKVILDLHSGRVEITYFFDDANTGWQEAFDAVLPEWASVADHLASHIRSGGSAANMGFEIPWDEQPPH